MNHEACRGFEVSILLGEPKINEIELVQIHHVLGLIMTQANIVWFQIVVHITTIMELFKQLGYLYAYLPYSFLATWSFLSVQKLFQARSESAGYKVVELVGTTLAKEIWEAHVGRSTAVKFCNYIDLSFQHLFLLRALNDDSLICL